jgi:plastocyanin
MRVQRFFGWRMARIAALMVLVCIGIVVEARRADAGGGGCHRTDVTTGDGTQVETVMACFDPNVLYIEPGETVTWSSQDELRHTVNGLANGWGSQEILTLGMDVSVRFDTPGTYPYSCPLHHGNDRRDRRRRRAPRTDRGAADLVAS